MAERATSKQVMERKLTMARAPSVSNLPWP
jgi:hypothetical protein